MERDRPPARVDPDPSGARALVDAGGATDAVLSNAIRRRLRDLAAGQVLEVVSREPTARLSVPAWCRLTGHELVQHVDQDEESRFWIRKCSPVINKEDAPP
jgi:TusA-related sulfurtransferase